MKKKAVKLMSILLAAALLVCASVGGTLAYLSAMSETVVNTFTVGNINIKLEETTGDEYQMVPGSKIVKDPKVTVLAGSEDCWLFVKIVEENNTFDADNKYISYNVDAGWKELTGQKGVYYRAAEAGNSFNVLESGTGDLENGFVTVNANITKTHMDNWEKTPATRPTLSFTAYAVQSDNITGADDAAKAAAAWAYTANAVQSTVPTP